MLEKNKKIFFIDGKDIFKYTNRFLKNHNCIIYNLTFKDFKQRYSKLDLYGLNLIYINKDKDQYINFIKKEKNSKKKQILHRKRLFFILDNFISLNDLKNTNFQFSTYGNTILLELKHKNSLIKLHYPLVIEKLESNNLEYFSVFYFNDNLTFQFFKNKNLIKIQDFRIKYPQIKNNFEFYDFFKRFLNKNSYEFYYDYLKIKNYQTFKEKLIEDVTAKIKNNLILLFENYEKNYNIQKFLFKHLGPSFTIDKDLSISFNSINFYPQIFTNFKNKKNEINIVASFFKNYYELTL